MGKKPNRGNTPEQPPPLDDDAHWMRVLDAVMLLFEQTHEMDLVELDIDQALAVGKLSSMRRNLTTGERECLLLEHWKANQVKCVKFPEHGWHAGVYPRREQRWGSWAHRDDDHAYFVSKADFAMLWTTAAKVEPPPRSDKPQGHGRKVACLKDVLRVVCPNGVPTGTKDKDVLTLVKSKYKDEGWELPKRDVIARALGRRK